MPIKKHCIFAGIIFPQNTVLFLCQLTMFKVQIKLCQHPRPLGTRPGKPDLGYKSVTKLVTKILAHLFLLSV